MALLLPIKLFSNQLRTFGSFSHTPISYSSKTQLFNGKTSIRSFAAKKAPAKTEEQLEDDIRIQQEFRDKMTGTLGYENVEQEEQEIEDEEIQKLRRDETARKKFHKSNVSAGVEYKINAADESSEQLDVFRSFTDAPMQYASRNLGHGALPDSIKMEMYKTWRKDPKYWTLNNLAAKFYTTAERSYAIIVDKRKEHLQSMYEGRPLSTWHQETFEKEFAMFITDRVPSDQGRRQDASPHFDFLEGDISASKGATLLRKSLSHPGLGRVPHHELPEEPPKRFTKLQKIRTSQRELIKPKRTPEEVEKLKDEHNIPNGGGKITFVDSSPRRHPYTREVYVMELDGSVRTGSWEERRELLKPPVRLLSLQRRFEDEVKKADEDFGKKMKLKNEAKRNEPNQKVVKKNVNFLDVLSGRAEWMHSSGIIPIPEAAAAAANAKPQVMIDESELDAQTADAIANGGDAPVNKMDGLLADIEKKAEGENADSVEETPKEEVELDTKGYEDVGFRNPNDIPVPLLPVWFEEIRGTPLEITMFDEPKSFNEDATASEESGDEFSDEEGEAVEFDEDSKEVSDLFKDQVKQK